FSLEDEAPARVVIGRIRPEEIDAHAVEFLSAIGREGLQGFVALTVLALVSQHRGEIRVVDKAPHPDPQLGLEGIRILTESIVEESYPHRPPGSEGTESLSKIERSRLTDTPRERIGPIFGSVEITHLLVVGVDDNSPPCIDLVSSKRHHGPAGARIATHA